MNSANPTRGWKKYLGLIIIGVALLCWLLIPVLALLKLERNDEAREALDRALAIRPDYADAADARGSLAPLGQRSETASEAS